jgi:hypothetical protein
LAIPFEKDVRKLREIGREKEGEMERGEGEGEKSTQLPWQHLH